MTCLAREDGAFPVKILSTRVGDIRPLGIGVGGMAILAAASDDDIRRIAAQHRPAFDAAGLAGSALARAVARNRRNGYSDLVDTVTVGVGGVGAVIPGAGASHAAIPIASIKPRMGAARLAQLGQLLLTTLKTTNATE